MAVHTHAYVFMAFITLRIKPNEQDWTQFLHVQVGWFHQGRTTAETIQLKMGTFSCPGEETLALL